MVVKIIVITVVYAFAIFGIVMYVDSMSNLFIPLILSSSLIFSILLIREIYKKVTTTLKPVQQPDIHYQTEINNPTHEVRKISEKPFLFGLEKNLVSPHEFYFDDQHFYALNLNGEKAIFPLVDIVEVSGTSVIISNRRIWKVKITSPNGEIEFKLAPNYTIWNKSFEAFYQKIKSMNPNAVKSKWSLWRM